MTRLANRNQNSHKNTLIVLRCLYYTLDMADTISVRFDVRTREALDREAARLGVGISTFVRQLAESELKRIQRASIRAESEALSNYLEDHPTAFDDDNSEEWFSSPDIAQLRARENG